MEKLQLIRRSFPEQPELGTAVSRAILARVAAGELPATVRIHLPAREVAFGRQDVVSEGIEAAAEAARAAGFAAVERMAGGRAAVFHEGTVAIARAYPDPEPPRRTYRRFEEMAEVVAAALEGFGIEARVGEVPGEYCPGAYSVSARGERKLAGIGQRMIRGGAHVGVVVVASGGDAIREVLTPVYAALRLEWDPAATGSVSGELDREVGAAELAEALVAELDRRYELEPAELDERTMSLARRLLAEGHRGASLPPQGQG
jgi:octanoyl-[GcvH]:protein N-octanoyltransferase